MTTFWKVACQEDLYPGMWQRWLKNQCVAVGWAEKWGYKLEGASTNKGWSAARNALNQMSVGDVVVVALRNNRVGRIGTITAHWFLQDPAWKMGKWDAASSFDGI